MELGALALGGALLLGGCGEEVVPTVSRTSPPGIVLETAIGPVTVLGIRENPGEGVRALLLQAVDEEGEPVRRSLRLQTVEEVGGKGFFTTTFTLHAEEGEVFRLTRRVREGNEAFLEATLESGRDRLHLRTRPVEEGLGLYVAATREGKTRTYRRNLEPARFGEAAYGAGVTAELEELYPSGPLVDGRERRLLDAVLSSPTWGDVMGEVPAGSLLPLGADDDGVVRNIRRMCAVSSLASKLSCMATSIFPIAWVVCVPSSGIQIACLALRIYEEFSDNFDTSEDWPCSCNEPPPDPDPGS